MPKTAQAPEGDTGFEQKTYQQYLRKVLGGLEVVGIQFSRDLSTVLADAVRMQSAYASEGGLRVLEGESELYQHALRGVLLTIEETGIPNARELNVVLADAQAIAVQGVEQASVSPSGFSVAIGGTEFGPFSRAGIEEMKRLQEEIGDRMNIILGRFFEGFDRYFGEFPYPDRETGAPRLSEVIALRDKATRDNIVALIQERLRTSGIPDITITTRDDDRDVGYNFDFTLKATGESITSNLKAYQVMAAALRHIEAEAL